MRNIVWGLVWWVLSSSLFFSHSEDCRSWGKARTGLCYYPLYFYYITSHLVSVFQEHWKRKQIILATEWGQLDFEDDEHIRAEFKGVIRCSPVTDQFNEVYYPPWKRIIKMIISVSFSIFLICLSIFFCISSPDLRTTISKSITRLKRRNGIQLYFLQRMPFK